MQVTETNPTKFRQKTIKNKGGAGEGREFVVRVPGKKCRMASVMEMG